MRYSLLSRFRGALLGAAVGDGWGSYGHRLANPQLAQLLHGMGDQAKSPPRQQTEGWGRLAVACAESLIERGCLDLENWKYSCQKTIPQVLIKGRGLAGVAIAILPVALFFHEDEAKLLIELERALEGWENTQVLKEGAIAVGYAIAQSLKEKLNPSTLIPQTITYLQDSRAGNPAWNDALIHQLAIVQTLLAEGASLEMAALTLERHAEDSLSNIPLALAFYCFLSTAEDLRLSVMRAAGAGREPQIVAAIVGALSGAYNAQTGIPVEWRDRVRQPDDETIERAFLWGTKSTSEIIYLSDRLLAAWCGVYDTADIPIESRWFRSVAAPKVIRPR